MKSRWIEHKGKRIFYADFSGFGLDVSALEAETKETNAAISARPEGSVLVIVDAQGTVLSGEAMQVLKAGAVETKSSTRKTAVVGITGYKKVLFDAIAYFSGRSYGSFDDIEKAKDWIVEED